MPEENNSYKGAAQVSVLHAPLRTCLLQLAGGGADICMCYIDDKRLHGKSALGDQIPGDFRALSVSAALLGLPPGMLEAEWTLVQAAQTGEERVIFAQLYADQQQQELWYVILRCPPFLPQEIAGFPEGAGSPLPSRLGKTNSTAAMLARLLESAANEHQPIMFLVDEPPMALTVEHASQEDIAAWVRHILQQGKHQGFTINHITQRETNGTSQ